MNKQIIIRPLSSNFTYKGFTYAQILHEGRKYLYEQTVTPSVSYFEVFRANIGEEVILGSKHYPIRHLIPKNGDFGLTAWSCRSFQKAKDIFDNLAE